MEDDADDASVTSALGPAAEHVTKTDSLAPLAAPVWPTPGPALALPTDFETASSRTIFWQSTGKTAGWSVAMAAFGAACVLVATSGAPRPSASALGQAAQVSVPQPSEQNEQEAPVSDSEASRVQALDIVIERTEPAAKAQPSSAPEPTRALEASAFKTPTSKGGKVSEGALVSALNAISHEAGSCVSDDVSGAADISLTFAPSGRVTSTRVESGPFVGNEAGSCIARVLRKVTVPAFHGKAVTVHKTIRIR